MASEVATLKEQDHFLREGIRQNLSSWLQKLSCDGDVERKLEYKKKLVKKLRVSPIAVATEQANEQHYEVPTEFFLTVLGKRLKYSSCIWPEGVSTLEQAEDAVLDQVCKRAQVEDGQDVMDLGCGWGSLALWVCEKYPNCKVTCVSNSQTQRAFIEKQAQLRGFTNRLQCITADANVFSTSLRFDRIISNEMFEHMKNYEILMSRVSSWLKPHGLLFIQILCHREFAYEFKTKKGSDTEWMAKNFFTGGTMPSSDLFFYFQKDLFVKDHWHVNGKHYSKTLEAWLERMYENLDKVKEVFSASYGSNNVTQQVFNWRMFFIYCSETFGFNHGNDWMVSHYLFKKRVASSL
ncbi:(S)-coclaurine N-methyltransferase [Nematostella vectensis]|uniref:(S)-coclaurine N-methyltransferase n=1 Tax=Nematostella vectensis TaxID=45351 RepID=UPI002076FE44|nr:(S)-coclaurine N-methyltransferase [Nematostella vectensis]